MTVYKIQARHTPCFVKQTDVAAASEDDALQAFVRVNLQVVRDRYRNPAPLVKLIEAWAASGGLDDVDIREAGPGESKEAWHRRGDGYALMPALPHTPTPDLDEQPETVAGWDTPDIARPSAHPHPAAIQSQAVAEKRVASPAKRQRRDRRYAPETAAERPAAERPAAEDAGDGAEEGMREIVV